MCVLGSFISSHAQKREHGSVQGVGPIASLKIEPVAFTALMAVDNRTPWRLVVNFTGKDDHYYFGGGFIKYKMIH